MALVAVCYTTFTDCPHVRSDSAALTETPAHVQYEEH